MMIKLIMGMMFLSCLLVFMTGIANRAEAQTTVPPGKWWTNPRVVQDIKLTEAEKKKLDDIYTANQRKAIDLKRDIEKERLELSVLLDKKELNESAVIAQYKKMEAVRTVLSLERFKAVIEVRKLLGPDRYELLKNIYRQARTRRVPDQPQGGAATPRVPPKPAPKTN